MGHGFGQLAKLRGIITYHLSPFEQRAFAGVISKGIPNTIRRISENVFRVAPRKFLKYLFEYILSRQFPGFQSLKR